MTHPKQGTTDEPADRLFKNLPYPEGEAMNQIGVLIIGGLMMFSCAGQRPENSGVQNGRLADCPSSPNCVSSQAADDRHGLPPLRYQGGKEAAFKRLKQIIASIKGNTIVSETGDYLQIGRASCRERV